MRLSTNTSCVCFAVEPAQRRAWKVEIPGQCIAIGQPCSMNPNMWKVHGVYVLYQEAGSW